MEEEVFISELHGTMHDLSKAGLAVPKCDVVRVQCVQLSEVYPLAQLCVCVGRGGGRRKSRWGLQLCVGGGGRGEGE